MTDVLPAGLATEEFSSDIRAQDDLYRYVNGDWLNRTEIPGDKARWGSFHMLAEQAEKDVRTIIEESQDAEPGTLERKIGDLFTSFMDTASIDAAGIQPLQETLAEIDQIDSIPALLATTGAYERDGRAHLIGLYIDGDPGDPERYVPILVQSGLSLPDESYYRLDNFADTRAAYRTHLERLLALAAVADPAGDAARSFALETEIASQHWDNVASRDAVKTYNLKSWDDFSALVGVDLAPWRDAVVRSPHSTPDSADALPGASERGAPAQGPHPFDEVVVSQPSAFEGLGSLLTAERLEDWKAWLRAKVVHAAAPFLTDDIVQENFSFYGTELTGVPTIRERWKRGVSLTEGALGEAIGKVYVQRHYPPTAKAAMDELVGNLIEAYRQSIATLEWMSPDTRERALAKLDAFTPKIGHPEVWRDYSSLAIDAADLFGNVRRANIFEHDRNIDKIGKPIDRNEWHMPPQMVNAYYNPSMNEIVFPAAILQYPFFDASRDAAANYGGIGAVIGHEIGHGFDDQGSRYDGSGKLDDWWTDADRSAFEERTKALIAQYDALVPEGLAAENHVNGALTIGENIGDLGGLGIALKAYELSLRTDPSVPESVEGPVIDGLTGVQRLLLSWAQVWQQKSRDAETIRLLTIDPHSPNEFRCNQIVRNIDAFYEAFGVTETDALYLPSDQRVTIW